MPTYIKRIMRDCSPFTILDTVYRVQYITIQKLLNLWIKTLTLKTYKKTYK